MIKLYVLILLNDLGFRLEFEIENFVEENTERDCVILVSEKLLSF